VTLNSYVSDPISSVITVEKSVPRNYGLSGLPQPTIVVVRWGAEPYLNSRPHSVEAVLNQGWILARAGFECSICFTQNG
jgi:hypothetical protein